MRQAADMRSQVGMHTIKVTRHADGRYLATSPGSGLPPVWAADERGAITKLSAKLDQAQRETKLKGL